MNAGIRFYDQIATLYELRQRHLSPIRDFSAGRRKALEAMPAGRREDEICTAQARSNSDYNASGEEQALPESRL